MEKEKLGVKRPLKRLTWKEINEDVKSIQKGMDKKRKYKIPSYC